MISNLTIRSNLIEGFTRPSEVDDPEQRMNAPLARISARDLDELCDRYPLWTRYFDTRNQGREVDGLPTQEQKEQWIAYLFYGDKTVSMQEEDRYCESWLAIAREVMDGSEGIEPNSDIELAIECVCLFEAVKTCLAKKPTKNNRQLQERIDSYYSSVIKWLDSQGNKRSTVQDRVYKILGLDD